MLHSLRGIYFAEEVSETAVYWVGGFLQAVLGCYFSEHFNADKKQ